MGETYIELTASSLPGDRRLHRAFGDIAEALRLPMVVTGAVHYATKADFPTFDLMTCIRLNQTVEEVSAERRLNAENYLKPWSDLEQLFVQWPAALHQTLALAERCQSPSLFEQRRPPLFVLPDGQSTDQKLRELARQGARWRYGSKASVVWPRIEHELAIIQELGFTDYFLVVWDVAQYARAQRIRFSGRGSAADSVVAYCLGITDVDAYHRQLLFERFMSRERAQAPDIDIDFDARYRDRIEEYVRQRYGAEHVARVATYQTYRARLAVREVGKALGVPRDQLERFARALPPMPIDTLIARWPEIPELRQQGPLTAWLNLLQWARRLEDRPRHLGTHLGGVVISQRPLMEISPCQRTGGGHVVVPFDKRDVEQLGLMKLDLLSLRIFSAVDFAEREIHQDQPAFDYEKIPQTDVATYRQLGQGEGIGVFQLESPAQRALAQRLQPDRWEDLVASLALIRPGPIKGNMVDPFIARRRGEEAVTYLHPALEPILSKTYGVILFQEQVIAIASALAGFTPGEADALRRVMTHGRSLAEMEQLGGIFRQKLVARGISQDVAEAIYHQIAGYASYGFNEAHAAAFAETAYRTAYLLTHYPREYFLGLLNAEPLGYYSIDVILVEARRRGIAVLPIDINRSQWEVTREGADGLRLGFRLVKGLSPAMGQALVRQRPPEGYRHPRQVQAATHLPYDQLLALIAIGAFDRLSLDRSQWMADSHPRNQLALSTVRSSHQWTRHQQVEADYRYLGFGQHEHWLARWRSQLQPQGFVTVKEALNQPPGTAVRLVAWCYRPHRPPTRSGQVVVFISLVDETGVLEARLSPQGYQRYGQWLFGSADTVFAVAGVREATGFSVRVLAPWRPPDHGLR
jgi:error-prone DNA polymerase